MELSTCGRDSVVEFSACDGLGGRDSLVEFSACDGLDDRGPIMEVSTCDGLGSIRGCHTYSKKFDSLEIEKLRREKWSLSGPFSMKV